jgi:hypothetical protein
MRTGCGTAALANTNDSSAIFQELTIQERSIKSGSELREKIGNVSFKWIWVLPLCEEVPENSFSTQSREEVVD